METISPLQFIEHVRCLAGAVSTLEEIDFIYGVPKNGLIVAQFLRDILVNQYDKSVKILIESEENILDPNQYKTESILVVDDLIDSGKTLKPYMDAGFKTAVLYKKPHSPEVDICIDVVKDWIHFWFEKKGGDIRDNITRLLEFAGEDPTREGLKDTPDRVARMYKEIFGGYDKPVEYIMKVFSSDNDEMVVVKDIDFYSHCEHHMVPFFGKVHIGYIPKGKVLGLSKFARLVEIYARRLQIQENLTVQIADAIQEYLKPLGVIVVIEAQHLCMAMRGVKKINSITTTSTIRGVFKDSNNPARAEFFSLIKK